MDLHLIWFLLLAILFVGYAILDGFDLGIGVLFYNLGKTENEKRTLINSIGPVWDGNEVWLLTGGGALFAAFPFVYATVFSGFYLAMMIVLFGLIFRAVGIEYYFKCEDDPPMQRLMGKMFMIGSLIPALLFGVAMGNLVLGIPLDAEQNYVGTFFELLHPYALILGVIGLIGFLLQGASYTILKTEGDLQQRAIKLTKTFNVTLLLAWVVGTIATFIFVPHMFDNYLAQPVLFVIPILSVVAMLMVPGMVGAQRFKAAFITTSLIVATKFITLAAGLFPNLVVASDPTQSLTIYNASSSDYTLTVMLVIALIGMPIVIGYTSFVYYMFRGKASHERAGY
ncbi:cytochrome d ubiquinol oxidase subunit II [Texcoconibacillus texcoconensis]|uniref:Cytochrome d ubiquinol oxidase subunit II n=1 Tax=Texcoconibacillus texcoconensis TaxID=1095777 RepID=A0A840QPP1_9BACI|nr:cytochrome d ubiquinol oxidase subunit II [Texcoconibacillus texcoconensis]MBB5173386.1 cytochrome d ubiquinol oxidase subunit II [Texcoconibacillus texcoconensis]